MMQISVKRTRDRDKMTTQALSIDLGLCKQTRDCEEQECHVARDKTFDVIQPRDEDISQRPENSGKKIGHWGQSSKSRKILVM